MVSPVAYFNGAFLLCIGPIAFYTFRHAFDVGCNRRCLDATAKMKKLMINGASVCLFNLPSGCSENHQCPSPWYPFLVGKSHMIFYSGLFRFIWVCNKSNISLSMLLTKDWGCCTTADIPQVFPYLYTHASWGLKRIFFSNASTNSCAFSECPSSWC